MFVSIRNSVILIFFIGIIGQFLLKETNGEERNIMFNQHHYHEEREEAKAKLYDAALKICPDKTEEVKVKLRDYEVCSAKIDEYNVTMCEVIEQNLKTCVKPLMDYYEICLPKKAKGIPTYVLGAAERLTKYVCDINGRHFLELGNHCILKKHHIESRRCIKRFNAEVGKYHYENYPEKHALCLFIKDFKSCFDTHVETFCKDAITREAYIGLYNVFLCE